jgi:uncharacterized protein involved in exopolysaccharide biosynthesis
MATEVSTPPVHAHEAEAPSQIGSAHIIREISVVDVLIVIARRKRTVFLVTASFAVAAVIISFLLPPSYTARVTLMTPQQNSTASMLNSQMSGMGAMAAIAGGTLGLKNPNDMYVALLLSRTVEDAMVKRFDLQREYRVRRVSDARTALERHSVLDGSNKDTLIHLSVQDRDPNRAAEIANGWIEEFKKLSGNLAITEAAQRRVFFEDQLKQTKEELGRAEEALKQTQQTTGLIQLDSQARALIETAAGLRAQITAKQVQITSLQTFATDQNAQLVQAQNELEALRSALAKLGGSDADIQGGLLVPKGKVPEAGLEYIRRLRDVKYYETIFEILSRQFEMAKLDEARQGAVIQVVDRAVPPDGRSFPNRELIVIGTTFLGFVMGVLFAIARAGLDYWKSQAGRDEKLSTLRQVLSLRKRTASS